VEIQPGRLIERPCPDCGGTERRAFGEAESRRGELASYAFGWTAGHEDHVGHMTIGIGAGNEGGGSFHVEIRSTDESWGMGLVDRPFEDVPEGGPDLSREEALAHEDLPFIWFVADNVMEQDRRAWWMQHWLEDTGAYVTVPVFERAEPVRGVVRDDDGDWQLLCGTPGAEEEARLIHLSHALDDDQTLLEVLDLEPGERADRERIGAPWERGAA
jgi:hypothetical protein